MSTGVDAAEKVVERWKRAGIQFDTTATEQDLADIERAHSVSLPASFRRLWSLSDGTATDDDHWLIFLQASDLVQPSHGVRVGDEVHLIFADWKRGTSFALVLAPHDRGVVVIDSITKRLSASFDAFLEMYLTREQIWPLAP